MAKDYFRIELEKTLGLVCSANCNTVYAGRDKKYAVCGALESVYVWNIRAGEIAYRWREVGLTAEALLIVASPVDENMFAVGYADGSVRIWMVGEEAAARLVFTGHKNHITSLAFDSTGTRLASGSRDCEIVIWDLVGEAGLFRLRGHTNAVTGLLFLEGSEALVSASKDTLLKVWDLASQHCIETSVLHHAEISNIIRIDTGIVATFGADKKIRIFRVLGENVAKKLNTEVSGALTEEKNVLEQIEEISRTSNERALWATADHDKDKGSRYVAVLSVDKSCEVWQIVRNPDKGIITLKSIRYTRLQSKGRSVEFAPGWRAKTHASVKLLVGFVDNQIAEVRFPFDSKEEIIAESSVTAAGHRSECRTVAFAGDGKLFATAGKEEIKIWNATSGNVVRTIDVAAVTTLMFIANDRGLLVADEKGHLSLIDLVSADVIDNAAAHEGAIRSMVMRPDGKGMMTGGDDKTIKFWEFKKANNALQLKLKMVKAMQMNDEIICLRYSHDLKYIAVATMDMTIKVFFADSLKFYLSLYGHKLPVTSMDISADGKVLVSVSSDKNIKIWSLEFGECRKSIFAHTEGITGVAFVNNSSMFLTASKDRTVKYWDCDGFVELQKLGGQHQGEIWAMAVSPLGERMVTVSKDRSVRMWRQTDELLFPEEEKENAMEEQFEKSLVEENLFEQDGNAEESGEATKKTIASMKAGERIVEVIEAADDERRKWDEYALAKQSGLAASEPIPGAFYLALGKDKTPAEFVLMAFERIPLPDIEQAMLCMPNHTVVSLLVYIRQWLETRRNIVMTVRVLEMVLRLFYKQIIADYKLRPMLESIQGVGRQVLHGYKDTIGFNNAFIKYRLP